MEPTSMIIGGVLGAGAVKLFGTKKTASRKPRATTAKKAGLKKPTTKKAVAIKAVSKTINTNLSKKYNIGRYGNKGHEVQDNGRVVFISNSSNDDYTNWLLAVDFAKKYFKPKTTARKPAAKKPANKQTGATHVYQDKQHKAKKPGKRVSANGNVYYEKRANRSDVGKLLGSYDQKVVRL